MRKQVEFRNIPKIMEDKIMVTWFRCMKLPSFLTAMTSVPT